MAAKRKVDLLELERLLQSDRTMEQIGQRLGVNKATISKNAKALRFCGAKDVVLRSAQKINDQKISAMERLNTLMETVQGELRYTQEAMKDTKGGERREWQDSLIKHAAEIRKQLSLLREIMQAAYDIQMIEEFKQIVMEEIGNESPETRQRILERIKQRRVDRGFSAVG